MVEGQKARAFIDSGSQLSSISLAWVKKLKLKPWQLHSVLQIEGSRSSKVPYLGHVEAHLKVPEVSAFGTDVLLLIVPDSVHVTHTSITLETLHIDMAINLATKTKLQILNKQWNRSLIATKLAMKEAQLVNQEDVQIVSQINNVEKITKDPTIAPFGTIKVKGVIKAPNHYKCINVAIDDRPDEQHCKDIAVLHQMQILRPGSNKIPIVLQNLSCQVVKIKKGTKIAHVMASNVVAPIVAPQLNEKITRKAAGNTPKSDLFGNPPEENSSNSRNFWRV